MKNSLSYFFIFILNTFSCQHFYGLKLYGINGKAKTIISYSYENENLKVDIDANSYKSKTTSLFNEKGELMKTIREFKTPEETFIFSSKISSYQDKIFKLMYNQENKLTDSISYQKFDKNIYKIYGKKIGKNVVSIGEQIINDNGRDLCSRYIDYENSKIIDNFSYNNIIENNLIVKTLIKYGKDEVTEFYEYSSFDENNNPKRILIFESDKKNLKKIIVREITYY